MNSTFDRSLKNIMRLIVWLALTGWHAQSTAQDAPVHALETDGLAYPAYPTYTGRMMCDDNIAVTIYEDRQKTGQRYFIHIGNTTYQALRVKTESGAIRLEDKKQGVIWLQMSNQSMLLNQRLGQRMAQNCRNDLQWAVEKALEQFPQANYLTQK